MSEKTPNIINNKVKTISRFANLYMLIADRLPEEPRLRIESDVVTELSNAHDTVDEKTASEDDIFVFKLVLLFEKDEFLYLLTSFICDENFGTKRKTIEIKSDSDGIIPPKRHTVLSDVAITLKHENCVMTETSISEKLSP